SWRVPSTRTTAIPAAWALSVTYCRVLPCDHSPSRCWLLAAQRLPLATAHIPHRQCASAPFLGPVHHRPADFVFDGSRALLLLGQKPVLAPLEPLPAPRALSVPRLCGLECGEPLGGVLMGGAQAPCTDDDRRLALGHGCGVDLLQIHPPPPRSPVRRQVLCHPPG